MRFARFMATDAGRTLRVVVGAGLALVGLFLLPWGLILVVVGAAVAVAGLTNRCLIAPLLGVPFRGADIPAAGSGESRR
ncbi:YgaP-like transmembrane domain [Pseudolysinimonas sp.]|uniref:YgaP-like transmembrane domain n=1 Tax=Pseudolysinimonas sp. TaxID=2680009 RepID=UPI003F7FF8C3